MNPLTQAKVLRALEAREIERLGGNTPIVVDVRILSATHKDLSSEVGAARFRSDLLYRLKVVSLELPALRHRLEDLPLLIGSFLELFCLRHKKQVEFSENALDCMARYAWPGNVRELRNVIEGCVVLNRSGRVQAAELPVEIVQPHIGADVSPDGADHRPSLFDLPYKTARREFETSYIVKQLGKNDGNISRTAAQIGLHRQSLQQKLKELGISRGEEG